MISKEDKAFLDNMFDEELSAEQMDYLDSKLKDDDFRAYYESLLQENYNDNIGELLIKYIPMIILVTLIIIGFYLIFFNYG